MASTDRLSFAEIVARFEKFLSKAGRTRSEVVAELERTNRAIDSKVAQMPGYDDPINASARAGIAALYAAIANSATGYLTNVAPIIMYVTTTQTTTIDIAKERYMNPDRSREIERLNDISDPLSIPPGTELKIYGY